MSDKYVYLFTRQDLSHQQQVIQTAHAICEMGVHWGREDFNEKETPNAVLIGVESEDQLLDIRHYLDRYGVASEMFYEPDISAYTSIATYPLEGKERKPLLKFELM
jgi:hypothetical protein